MDGKLSQTASNTKMIEAEQQDAGLAKVNKHQQSYKRRKNMNEGIETQKEPHNEQFGDVDFNDESAPQKNDLGFGSAKEASGAQPAEGNPMSEDNVEAPPMVDPPQTEVSQKQKEIVAPIDDTYLPDRNLLLIFKFHQARSIYLGQKSGCFRVHHHAPTWHLEKEPTFVRDLAMLATECEQLRVTIEQMRVDKTLNDVFHEQFIKSFEELPAKLEEKLAVILKGDAVPSPNLKKNIDELTIKYEDAIKRLSEKESFIIASNYRWTTKYKSDTMIHDKKIETLLADKDDPTFIELFDQYDRFYTIVYEGTKGDYQDDFTVKSRNQDKLMEVRKANVVLKKKINKILFILYVKFHLDVRGVQGEDDNYAFRVPATIKHQSKNQFKKVMNLLESLMTKDPAFWKTVFSQSLDAHFSSRGEKVCDQLRRACSYGGQHVEYRHMGHWLATC
ncbi:hypothetical protein GIB67_032005 [Kingdonia uniflora]|uniref:Uncharacterized protein n=1 Tax=Kingdonia uniflora TaxID=39325 RepID=A0A7J7MWM0_9MAGN|nr:hypothetical protein GIB67_032005 [Kingdonia uniflora]